MSTIARVMTADELLQLPRGRFRYELIKGELLTMSPAGSAHGAITQRLSTLLDQYVTANGLGLVFGAETGFLIATRPDTVLAPDIAFVSARRIPATGLPEGFWPGAPDLAVEVVSPGDSTREVDEKVAAWLTAGSEMVWVVRGRPKTVTVHHVGGKPEVLGVNDVLEGGSTLPGFRCRVADIFSIFGK
ncbi:MAG TPA: Uma2 family endonuclease [Planctomycetaceae bacterium]